MGCPGSKASIEFRGRGVTIAPWPAAPAITPHSTSTRILLVGHSCGFNSTFEFFGSTLCVPKQPVTKITMFAAVMAVSLGIMATDAPCDILAAHGTPCVAAHSVVRALFQGYSGPLYQVVRTTDRKSLNISLVPGTGYADAAAQSTFCSAPETTPNAAQSDRKRGVNVNATVNAMTAPSGAEKKGQTHAEIPWAPGPCCGFENCPDRCDQRSPGACPAVPGCVGCASCGTPTHVPPLATCMITRIFDQTGNGNHLHVVGQPSGLEPVSAVDVSPYHRAFFQSH